MSNTRKSYTKEFKLEAIQLADTSGKSISQVERELGLPKGSIFRWKQALARQGEEAFPGKGHLPATEEQVRQLERENLILRQERDILKKAIAVLSPKP
jgi:transposase